jgi:hypothetical protein
MASTCVASECILLPWIPYVSANLNNLVVSQVLDAVFSALSIFPPLSLGVAIGQVKAAMGLIWLLIAFGGLHFSLPSPSLAQRTRPTKPRPPAAIRHTRPLSGHCSGVYCWLQCTAHSQSCSCCYPTHPSSF